MTTLRRDPLVSAFLLFVVLLFSVTSLLLWKHPFLNFDDFALVDPLKTINSVSEYFAALEKNLIMDIAPVRDLTYWLELQFESYTGLVNHQLINVVIWVVTIALMARVLKQLKVRPELIAIAILLVGLHPLIHNSVFWIAGRKHLLAACFLMAATLFLLKSFETKKNSSLALSVLFFFLSCFSQPIGVGFPIFVATFLLFERRWSLSEKIYLGICVLLAGTVAFLNWTYYASDSYANTGGLLAPKFHHESLEMIWKRFLVWGRDVFQVFVPVRPSITSYNLQSMTSLIGLSLLALIIAVLIRYRSKLTRVWPWLVYLSLPIGVVTFKLTSQGGVDTYLLSPLLGAGIAVALIAEVANVQVTKQVRAGVAVVVVLFLLIDFRMADAWSSTEELWATAVEMENSKVAKANYLRTLVNDPAADPVEVLRLALEMKQEEPESALLGYNLGKAIYLQKTTPAEKEKLFAEHKIPDAWFDYLWSANDAQQGLFESATERLFGRFNADPRRFMITMMFSLEDVQSKWTKMCELAKRTDCTTIAEKISTEKQRIEQAKR